MKSKPLPSQELLNELLRYNPDTGKLYWRKRQPKHFVNNASCGYRGVVKMCEHWNELYAGEECMTSTKKSKNHLFGTLLGQSVRSHRVIWKLMTDEDPDQIDHIDGDGSNNTWVNLRNVDMLANSRNKRLNPNNTSGYTGVHWDSKSNSWDARIGVKGKSLHLGKYKNKEDAIQARKEAETLYNFHPNHGNTL